RERWRTPACPSAARSSICWRLSPTVILPPSTAIVAGTAPSARIASSIASAVSTLAGYAKPCVISVDSSATTGRPSRSASLTSVENTSMLSIVITSLLRPMNAPPRLGAGKVDLLSGARQNVHHFGTGRRVAARACFLNGRRAHRVRQPRRVDHLQPAQPPRDERRREAVPCADGIDDLRRVTGHVRLP